MQSIRVLSIADVITLAPSAAQYRDVMMCYRLDHVRATNTIEQARGRAVPRAARR